MMTTLSIGVSMIPPVLGLFGDVGGYLAGPEFLSALASLITSLLTSVFTGILGPLLGLGA